MKLSDSWQWQRLSEAQRQIIRVHQALAPVDLPGIARAFGIPVKAATLPPGISGEIRPDGFGGYLIRVNRHDSPGRQRFTVAHELAHFLLHKDYIGAGITDDALYRSNQSNSIEAEANRLAADIVMPTAQVKMMATEFSLQGIGDIKGELAKHFGVSTAAMNIKLGGDG